MRGAREGRREGGREAGKGEKREGERLTKRVGTSLFVAVA
jgi:hypothetical protein